MRIDQVWVSKDLRLGLQKSDIEEIELVTESDYNLIWAQIKLDLILRLRIGDTAGRKSIERKIFLYKDTTKENWDNFTRDLKKSCQDITIESQKKLFSPQEAEQEKKERLINDLWDNILKAILKSANKHILSKKIKQTRNEFNKNIKPNLLYLDFHNINRLLRKGKGKERVQIDHIE